MKVWVAMVDFGYNDYWPVGVYATEADAVAAEPEWPSSESLQLAEFEIGAEPVHPS